MLPSFESMRLADLRQPFDHKDWVFELKYDGFRALAYVENGSARLISRKNNTYKSFDTLCSQIVQCLKVLDAILDGEVVCLGKDGRPRFDDLLRRRSPQYFYAFDLLWLNGRDLRELPLVERKRLLRRIIPNRRSVLFAKHVEGTGVSLFHAACEMDLEGIVAKWKSAPYRMDGSRTSWVKIKNPHYSQAEGRGELFEKFHSPHDTSRLVQQQAAGAKEKRGTSEGAQ